MRSMFAIIASVLLGAALAAPTSTASVAAPSSPPFQVGNFTAKVLANDTTVYTFDLDYHPSAPTTHCIAVTPAAPENCAPGNLCVSYGRCGESDPEPVLFNVGLNADGDGLVVSVQSNYLESAGICEDCAQSGLVVLQASVIERNGVQVYTGPGEFSVDAELTTY
ncbi:hypothetical protein VTK73DRAFT_2782 [Phialemonium thermophilum]|uniref:Uncharacterized protein n=1 Tax=Phialemonium thermophilum TaxID=223376 RepID=A0ABR3X306_9PEZI